MKNQKKLVKTKPKKTILRFVIFGVASFFLISTVLVSLVTVGFDILEKYKEKEKLSKNLTDLRKKEEVLTLDVEKMKDPEYVARYLREKFLYSKDGEYIIKIPDENTN